VDSPNRSRRKALGRSRIKRLDAKQSALTTTPDAANAEVRDTRAPADVIRDAVKRFDDQSGVGFIGRELLQAGTPSSPREAAQCGRILMEAGLVDEAEALYRAMVRSFPGHPVGFVGLAQVAMRRKRWSDALTHWESILTAFDQERRSAFWLSGRASVLFQLGHHQEAAAILADLVRDFPDEPPGYVGLAQLALRQHRRQEALARCDEILRRFGEHTGADGWRVMRASALMELGRADEAEAILREVVERSPGSVHALLTLLWVYVTTGRPEVALRALNSSPFREIQSPALIERRLDILIRLKRFEEADATFVRLLSKACRPDELSSLFAFVPALYQGYERQRSWTVLLERAATIQSSLELPDRVPLGILNARIRLALRDTKGVIEAMRDLRDHPHLGEHGEALRRVAAVLSEPRYPDCAKPKLFGIGFPKTGTTSLTAALTLLGFNTLQWVNPLTCELITDDDLFIFDAFTDTPISARFEFFYYLFPNSKFILNTRPFDAWVKSISHHWRRHYGLSDFDEIKAAMAEPKAFRYGIEFRKINYSLYFNYKNYHEAFQAHEQRVRSFFQDKPAGRFLELNIFAGDSWPKLCAFVGRDVPSIPFPWENRQPSAPGA
jgi:predicted Zn-dependent protease